MQQGIRSSFHLLVERIYWKTEISSYILDVVAKSRISTFLSKLQDELINDFELAVILEKFTFFQCHENWANNN